MAQLMTDEQRLKALEAYDPREHLIAVGKNKDNSPVLYYPAAWRLYELRLRHPNFVLESEIVHMDEDRGTVIIKAIGYNGLNYESSTLKGKAFKQGKLFELDKVETKAKSRVARDIGIGTEYALDMDADETDATHATGTPQERRSTTQHADRECKPVALVQSPAPSAPSANDHEKATAQQKEAIRKMSATLQQGVPEDIDTMTYGSAKAVIAVLSADYRASKAS